MILSFLPSNKPRRLRRSASHATIAAETSRPPWIIIGKLAVIAGLVAKSADGAGAFAYPLLFLPFVSSAFVLTRGMPGPVKWFAEHQPLSVTVDAVRACFIGGPTATKVLHSILWSVGIIAVFAPIAVRKYRRVA